MTNTDRLMLQTLIENLVAEGFAESVRTSKAYKWYQSNDIQHRYNIEYESGASKVVLIPEESDYVIKCTVGDEPRDYCAREYENYVLAEQAGLKYYFAETVYIGTFEGVGFYAQEMVECDESVDSSIYDSLDRRYRENGSERDSDCLWDELDDMDAVDRVDLLYADPELCDFIAERLINGLHCGNFGIKGDHYVMIDFSGYGIQIWG